MDKTIVHLADFQVEARNSGIGNRYDEYKNGLSDALESIKNQSPDIVIITGDLYQFADTTAAERKLLTWFLKELAKISNVVITNGNHDLKQRNNQLIISDKNQTQPDDIESVLDALSLPNIKYLKRTGFYNVFDQDFAVWGHYEKFNKVEDDLLPYSPWDLPNADDYISKAVDGTLIELYHDPISNCKGFSGKPELHFVDYKMELSMFKSKLVLAGDIHAPDIIEYAKGCYFTYCSSTIMRNHGEGNYYKNSTLIQDGNNKHGYNSIKYVNGVPEITFVEIHPRVGRHTIYLDADFNYNNISELTITQHNYNIIRFVVEDNVNDFFTNQDLIFAHLKTKYNCLIEDPRFDKNIGIEMDDEHTVDNIESIVTEEKIMELSEIYINKVIDKTTTIAADDRPAAKRMLLDLFNNEFLKRADVANTMKYIQVNRLNISNALTFGDDVEIIFNESGITRITGSNAVGKTKIFTILGYMFTDKLYADQKVSQYKNNRLDLFNYNRPNDEVFTEMDFSINKLPYKLSKRVTRGWKRGKNMWNDKDWRDHINATPDLEIILTTPEGVVTDYNEVMAFMTDLITFEEFYTHLFVNQRSLETLLKMNPDILIGEILKIIGLNFFDSLNDSFDEVRDTITNTLTKPQGTMDSLFEEINTNLALIESLTDEKSLLMVHNLSLDSLQTIAADQSENITKRIGSVREEKVVQAEIDTANEKIKELNGHVDRIKLILDADRLIYDGIDVLSLKSDNIINNATISQNNKEIATNEASKNQLDAVVANLKSEINNFKNEHENKKNGDKNIIDIEINKQKEKQAGLSSRAAEIKEIISLHKQKLKDEKQLKIDKLLVAIDREKIELGNLESALVKNENIIATNEIIITNSNLSIETLIQGKTCPTCLREKDETKLDGINESIAKHERDILHANAVIDDTKTLIDVLGIEIETVSSHVISGEANILKMRSEEIEYSLKDNSELFEEGKILKLDHGLAEEIILKLIDDKSVIDLDNSYLTSDYITKREDRIANIKEEEAAYDASIVLLEKSIDTIRDLIKACEDKIDLKSTKEIAIIRMESEINNHTKDISIIDDKLGQLNTEIVASIDANTLFDELAAIKTSIYDRKIEITENENDINEKTIAIKMASLKIEECETNITNLKQYNLTTAVIKQYKTMLGKTGLQKYIFGKIVDILNTKLSDLLQDVDFRLFFDKESLDLRKYSLRKNVISGVQMTSGMETTILGLSLLNSLKMLNQIRKFNFLMIDEVSGQMNNGKNLTYSASDYQDLLVQLLHKIRETSNIYIVDHVLEFLGETSVLEVQYTEHGSIVTVQ